jgi:hypothetical protein
MVVEGADVGGGFLQRAHDPLVHLRACILYLLLTYLQSIELGAVESPAVFQQSLVAAAADVRDNGGNGCIDVTLFFF